MEGGFEHLLAEGIISEVIARLKSGKEADVYAVRYGGRVVAAKVYKDRAQRSFKNNAAYTEGRSVRNSRSQRAMDRKTGFGQATAEAAWKSAEADVLYKLHAADVRVPTPVMFLEGVLLMELVLGEDGEAAPRLIDTQLTIADANLAYRDMLSQLVRILACDLIHGDLSPYNVLWGANGPTIIDFPQAISASHNRSSEAFFLRDARNILGYFAGVDRSLHARSGDPAEIWRAYVRRELTPDFAPSLRAPRPAPVHSHSRASGPQPGRPHAHAQNQPTATSRPHANSHSNSNSNSHATPKSNSHSNAHAPPAHRNTRDGATRGNAPPATHPPEARRRRDSNREPQPRNDSNRAPQPRNDSNRAPQPRNDSNRAPQPRNDSNRTPQPRNDSNRAPQPRNDSNRAPQPRHDSHPRGGSRRPAHVPEVIVRVNRSGAAPSTVDKKR